MAQIKRLTEPFIENGATVGEVLLRALDTHSGPRLLADVFDPPPYLVKDGEIKLTLTMEVSVRMNEARDFLRAQGYGYQTPHGRRR